MNVLDTDTCVELLHGNPRVAAARERCDELPVVSTISVAELYFGAAYSDEPERNRELVDEFLGSLPVVELDRFAALIFGEIKASLRRAGRGLPEADLLIAATALACDAVLVTGNRRHYDRIPGLQLENWIR